MILELLVFICAMLLLLMAADVVVRFHDRRMAVVRRSTTPDRVEPAEIPAWFGERYDDEVA